jgi:hypothetical protein
VNSTVEIAVAAVAVAVIIFVPAVRRTVGMVLRISITIAAIVLAIGGVAVLMNNVSVYDSPGVSARAKRFLTVDWAATSEKGLGSSQCPYGWSGSGGKSPQIAGAPAQPEPSDQQDEYPELVRHGYPGISRATLFELAQQTVSGLGGWKIAASDRRAFTLDCVYTTRIFQLEDDIRIAVTAKNEIDLCSRSRKGEPGSTSWLWLFPADFGANIGHIKEFYEALEPRADAVYKEQERKINAERR